MQIASKEKPTRKRRQQTHHPTSQNRVRPKALDNRSTKARSIVPNKAPKKQEPDTCRYRRDEESTPKGPETARNQGSSNMGSQGRNPPRRKQWSRHDGKRTTCPQAACSSKANTRRLKREAKLTRHGKVSQTLRLRRPEKLGKHSDYSRAKDPAMRQQGAKPCKSPWGGSSTTYDPTE